MPPAQRWLDPSRRPRGAFHASSPWDPTGRMPAQAPRGCCPGRAAARRTRDIPTEFRAASARHRQFGGDAGPRGPSRIRRSAPRPGHIGQQAEQGGLASAADRGNPGKSPQRCKAPQKLLRERRTRVNKSRRACRTPAAALVQKDPENGLGTGSCADASARSAMRHRRRRKKGGGNVREPQGDNVAQAGRDHEAQEQRAARAARDDPDGGVRGVHGRARLPGRTAHEGDPRGEGQHHEDQVRGLHGERPRGRRGRRAHWGKGGAR